MVSRGEFDERGIVSAANYMILTQIPGLLGT
jgi:hypothetical protein